MNGLRKRQRLLRPPYWPPRAKIAVYSDNSDLIEEGPGFSFDLADAVAPHAAEWNIYNCQLGVRTHSTRWPLWTASAVGLVEEHLVYDLNFDGFDVDFTRRSSLGQPGTSEFRWSLAVQVMLDEDEELL